MYRVEHGILLAVTRTRDGCDYFSFLAGGVPRGCQSMHLAIRETRHFAAGRIDYQNRSVF